MNNRYIFSLSLILFFGFTSFARETDTSISEIKIKAINNFAPFSYKNPFGHNDGFSIDLINEIMEMNDLKHNLSLENNRTQLLSEIKKGEIDILTGAFYSEEYVDSMLFSEAIYYSSLAIASNRDNPFYSLASLTGKRLLLLKDDWSHEAILEMKLSSDISLFNSLEEGLEMLSTGEYDAIIYYEQTLRYFISQHKLNRFMVEYCSIPRRKFCIAVSKQNPELVQIINSSLHQMKVSGKFYEIYSTWFGVYDNNFITDLYIIISITLSIIWLVVLLILHISRLKVKKALNVARTSDMLKSLFLANVSHDIRTPLNAIVGFSSILVEEDVIATQTEKERYYNIIKDNTIVITSLVDKILDLSIIESGQMILNKENTDISLFFDELATSFAPLVTNPDVKFCVDNPFPASSLTISIDKKRLRQIITNFFVNSVKYTHSGNITIGYSYEKNVLKVYVKDTGIGISEEDQDKIFNRFYKVDPVDSGHGINLAINKAIMDSIGGKIGVTSQLGSGTTFWISFSRKAK